MAPLTMISVLLNGIVITAGVRNIMAPGTPLVMIPEDNVFQEHFHGILDVINDGDPKMAFIFQLLGIFFVMVAAAKLATLHAALRACERRVCVLRRGRLLMLTTVPRPVSPMRCRPTLFSTNEPAGCDASELQQ